MGGSAGLDTARRQPQYLFGLVPSEGDGRPSGSELPDRQLQVHGGVVATVDPGRVSDAATVPQQPP
jgi:hypothetical protein